MVFLGNAGGFPDSLRAGQPRWGAHLPPKTTSFKQWAERLQEYAVSRIAARAGLLAGRAAKTGRSLARETILGREHGGCGEHYQSHLIRKKPKLKAYNT